MDLRCDKCNLYKTSIAGNFSAVKIDGAGNINSNIMLIGEAPSYSEIREKKPFVGEPGNLLRKYLLTVGIDNTNAFFTYVCRCKPPPTKKPSKKEIEKCFPYLDAEIKKMKPQVIGALGASVCSVLEIEGKITSIRGSKIWNEKYNCWVVPVYKPSYVTRFINDSKQRKEFVMDLGLLKKLEGEEDYQEEKVIYKFADTFSKIKKATEYLINQKHMVVDIETNHLNCLKSKIACIGFSAQPKTGIVIPYQYSKIFNEKEQLKVKEYLTTILTSKVFKILQNGKFDVKHLLVKGIPIHRFFFDTMLAHYLLDETGSHGLGVLLQIYTSMPNHKDLMAEYLHSEKKTYNRIFEAPLPTLIEYTAKDADGEFRVFLKLQKLIAQEKLDKLFYHIIMPLTYVLAHMEVNGIEVDKKYVDKTATTFKYKLKEIERDLQHDKYIRQYLNLHTKEPEFNFNSPKQLRELLYEVMKIKPVKYNKPTKTKPKGSPSTDKETLEILSKTSKYLVLENMLKFRKIKKLQDYIKSYKELAEESVDGRIHTTYMQRGTRTGRLASSEPNLQNIPSVERDPINAAMVRNCLRAKEGYTLIEGDYSQMEFRIWADNSGDEKMIKYICNPDLDIHIQIASKVYNIKYGSVTEHQRSIAKGVVYGLMYGRGAYSIAKQFGVDVNEAERITTTFFKEFPTAANWLKHNVDFAKKHGYICNMFGRKRRLEYIHSTDGEKQALAERQTRNSPIQSGAADIVFIAMIKLFKAIKDTPMKMLLNVHDSIGLEVPDNMVKEACNLMKEIMENAVQLKVPLKVDFKIGKQFGEMNKEKSI